MTLGEFLTRSTVWLSIFTYLLGAVLFTARRNDYLVRACWTLGCGALIAHFTAAFQFHHGWSQAAAYHETARQTEQVYGFNWGGGLFINYGLLLLWIADIAWWWAKGIESYRHRPLPLVLTWHGILIFIIFNATVVFKDGFQRWVGLTICLLLSLAWLIVWDRRRPRLPGNDKVSLG